MRVFTSSTQLWFAAHDLLLERGDNLFSLLASASRSLDPEAIHDLRVSSRRLREGLSLFAPCYPPKHFAPLKRALKKLTAMMGSIRNTDEAMLFFAMLAPELPLSGSECTTDLFTTLQARRVVEIAALKHGLRKLDAATLRRQFLEKCAKPDIFTGSSVDLLQPVAKFLLAGIAARENPIGDIVSQAIIESNVFEQHRLRIAVKRFRYRFEFQASLAAAGYAELYAAIKGYQEILGKLHDLDTFSVLADEIIADRSAAGRVKELITRQRRLLFAGFINMHHSLPLSTLGDRARRLL